MTTSGGNEGSGAVAIAPARDESEDEAAASRPAIPPPGSEARRRGQVPARPPGRLRRRVAVAIAAVCVAALVARDWVATLDTTDRADSALDQAQTDLVLAEDDLEAARSAVGEHWATLDVDLATLDARQAERSEAQQTVDDMSLWLATLQDQLDTATTELETSSARLVALQDCLAGVAQALNQVAVHDGRVAGTLRDIAATCADAGVEL
jgi:septal ring factor EnvC (AmiA/AmiB activator)